MTKREREKPLQPPGKRKSLQVAVLEAGANLLQNTPLSDYTIYVVGFHCTKHPPYEQMEAHHFCRQVNDDFHQCVILDGNTEDANLIGIEYIISESLYEELPDEEKPYWHPHNYEVLSGQLIAPGLPDVAEKAMLTRLMNSYGKTWHTWHTGRYDGEGREADPLPYGDPMLMWSFNRDGEADASLVEDRDRAMDLDVAEKRRQRQDLARFAHPQPGVDLLKDELGGEPEPPEGVRDVEDHGGA